MNIIGSNIIHQTRCHNSMEWAQQNLATVSDGTVFLADHHDYTRGRQGRMWKFSPEQIVATIILKPTCWSHDPAECEQQLATLNMALAVGIAQGLEVYGVDVKWPNDFIINGKKTGGMLLQTVWQGRNIAGVILGIAINANNKFERNDELFQLATSLVQEYGRPVDKMAVLLEILTNLDHWYAQWCNSEEKLIFQSWHKKLIGLGKSITVHGKDGKIIKGTMHGVRPNGDLVIHSTDGVETIVTFCVIERLDIDF